MPKSDYEGTPHRGDGKISEESGRKIYGGSGSHQGPGKREEEEGEKLREGYAHGGPAPGGSSKSPGSGNT